MLDDNLPTFRFKPSPDNPLSTILFFTHNGADPSPEYLFRRAEPSTSPNRYAVALTDPHLPSIIFAEVLVEPQWLQPTLSAAELRAQQQQNPSVSPPVATPVVPDSFTIQLYNPDQSVTVRLVSGGFAKADSWEFELPVRTFKQPSASELDRATSSSPAELVPRVMFKWKKDGRLSKEMTCYMCGTTTADGRKNKEPDITVAMFRASKDSALTVYQPNLHRVEVEDRKGLEVVLLLGAEVIKDLWTGGRGDVWNLNGAGRRRPTVTFAKGTVGGKEMAGAVPSGVKPASPGKEQVVVHAVTPAAEPVANPVDVDAETRRLKAMVEREEREREKRERTEQKRIKKMLEEEEKERRRREAEVAKETERLRKKYGVEGQELPPLPPRPTNSGSPLLGTPPPSNYSPPPHLPPPQQQYYPPPPQPPPQQQFYQPPPPQQNLGPHPWGGPPPALPPRPVSAGPSAAGNASGPFHCQTLNAIWNGPSGGWKPPAQLAAHFPGAAHAGGRGRKEDGKKVQKKRSSVW